MENIGRIDRIPKGSKSLQVCVYVTLKEEEIKYMFLKALGELQVDKEKTTKGIEEIKAMLTDTSLEDRKIKEAREVMENVSGLLNKEIETNSKAEMNAEITAKKHEELIIR